MGVPYSLIKLIQLNSQKQKSQIKEIAKNNQIIPLYPVKSMINTKIYKTIIKFIHLNFK